MLAEGVHRGLAHVGGMDVGERTMGNVSLEEERVTEAELTVTHCHLSFLCQVGRRR